MKENVFVPTKNYQKFERLCQELMESRFGIEMAAVTGAAGRGKTTAAERVISQNAGTIYVLYERTMGGSIPMLFRAVSFRTTGIAYRSTEQCVNAIKEELRGARKLIMVDEADGLTIRQLDSLRNLHDTCGAPILLIGEDSLGGKLASQGRLMSRTREVLAFEKVSQVDVAVFYKEAFGQTLPKESIPKLMRHAGGDFRNILKDALAVERILETEGLGEINERVVNAVC